MSSLASLWLVVGCWTSGSPAAAQEHVQRPATWHRPSRAVDQHPFSLSRLAMIPDVPEVLPAGGTENFLQLDWSNTHNFENFTSGGFAFVTDLESARLEIGGRAGVGAGWEAEVAAAAVSRFGGGLDAFIERVHDLTGVSNERRDERPRNDYFVEARPGNVDADLFSLDRGVEWTSATAAVKRLLFDDGAGGVWSARLSARIPFGGEDDFRAPGIDAGLHLLGGWTWNSTTLHVNAGGRRLGREEWRTLTYERTAWDTAVLMAVDLGRDWTFLPQIQYLSGVSDDLVKFDRPRGLLGLAGRWDPDPAWGVEFGIVENFANHESTADFTLRMGLLFRH